VPLRRAPNRQNLAGGRVREARRRDPDTEQPPLRKAGADGLDISRDLAQGIVGQEGIGAGDGARAEHAARQIDGGELHAGQLEMDAENHVGGIGQPVQRGRAPAGERALAAERDPAVVGQVFDGPSQRGQADRSGLGERGEGHRLRL